MKEFMEETTEWRVTCFPPDKPIRQRYFSSEELAVSRFNREKEDGTAPVLEKRVRRVTWWESVTTAIDEEMTE
jgi:hypothetical protein